MAERGTTILVSTHYMDEAARCHRLAILDEGVKVADGSPKALGENIAYNVIEVVADNPNSARLSLADNPAFTSITQLGVRLRVLVPKQVPDALEQVRSNLRQAQVRAEADQVFPDLEDIFMAVTEERRKGLAI